MIKKTWTYVYGCGALLVLVALCTGFFWLWRYDREAADYQQAKELLAQSQVQAAADIILKHKNYLTSEDLQGIDWLPLTVEVLMQTGDTSALARLYEIYPRVVGQDQAKALAVAEGLIATRSLGRYRALRDVWLTRPHNDAAWFVLEADALMAQGKKQEATALLNSHTFDGPEDSRRLIRLAGYSVDDNPEQSWKLLEEALVKDPKNLYLRRYRGQIREKLQQYALAQREYGLAIEKSPNDPHFYQPLAEFFIRRGQIKLALETWKKALPLPDSDLVRLHVLFWTRVGVPMPVDWAALPASQSPLAPLIAYLMTLPADRMWDDVTFERLPDYQRYLKAYQETFWLRVIEALRQRKEESALDLVNNDVFISQSWSPDLVDALKAILTYRRDGALKKDENPLDRREFVTVHFSPLFRDLEESTRLSTPLTAETTHLLSGRYAFPVAFFTAGWFRAGLAFEHPATLPAGLPEWVPALYARAIWQAVGPLQALHFVNLQPVTDQTSLIKGQLMISLGSWDAGLRQLQPLLPQATDIGLRATYLTALVLLKEERYNEAKAVLVKNPLVGQTVIGKELEARIANAQRPIQRADRSDPGIGKQSLEWKRPLVKEARADDHAGSAPQLVESLIIDFPDERTLIEEWELIK